jgi:hypothetical protein
LWFLSLWLEIDSTVRIEKRLARKSLDCEGDAVPHEPNTVVVRHGERATLGGA